MRTPTLIALLLAGVCLLGCAAEVVDPEAEVDLQADEDVGVTAQAILNGSVASTETKTKGGLVGLWYLVNGGPAIKFFCSATLITNTRLITAKHCLTHPNTAFLQGRPGDLRVRMGNGLQPPDFQVQNGKTIYFPTSILDYALVEVASPFRLPRNSDGVVSTSGFQRQLGNVTSGQTVVCHGHGNTSPGSGAGQLHAAVLRATLEQHQPFSWYTFLPNSQQQIMHEGDSGGGCLVAGTPPKLVSVTTDCFLNEPRSCIGEIAAYVNIESWTQVNP